MTGFETQQGSAFAGLMKDVVAKIDTRFSDLEGKVQKQFTDAARDISKLSDSFEEVQRNYSRRFSALADEYQAGRFQTSLGSMENARTLGRMVAGILLGNRDQIAHSQKAAMNPATGQSGGFLAPEQIVQALIRNVETYGVFERNATIVPVSSQSGGMVKRTQGPTIGYPDLGVSPSETDIKSGRINFNLTRYAAYILVDRWMTIDSLSAVLGQFIADEMGWSMAYAQDQNAFIGDGSAAYAKVVGMFNRADAAQLTVTAATGDNTFQEVCDASTKYLSQAVGTLPDWADDEAAWYLHRSIFWTFLGARDSQNRPVADILATPGKPQRILMGYPANVTQVAPKLTDTAVSKVMAVLANLRRSHRLFRHQNGIEFRMSEHVRFLQGELCFAIDCLQDIVEADVTGYVQIKTAAS